MSNVYEVYVAYSIGGDVLYVGQGLTGRHKHCLSGVSHNKDLNRYFFSNNEGGSLNVEVKYTKLSKSDSLLIEKSLIKELKPKFNKSNPYVMEMHLKKFNSDYVDFFALHKKGYFSFFKDIVKLSDEDLIKEVADMSNVAEDFVNRGYAQKLKDLVGEQALYNTPFIINCNGDWVFNKASKDLFGITPDRLRVLV